jgi:hypothetical protein
LLASVSIGGFTCTSRSAFLSPSVAVNVSIVRPSPKAFELRSVTAINDNTARDAAKAKYELFFVPDRTQWLLSVYI